MDAEYSDGCTGFWAAELIWPIHECCVEHDFGGSDGTLLDCLYAAGVPMALAVLGVLIMVLFRPVYHWLKRKGLWPL